MPSPTLLVADRRTTVQVRQGATVAVTERPTTLQVTVAGQVLELPVRRSSLQIRAPLALHVPVRRTTLEFASPGVQGPPGPAQIRIGGSQPAPIPGYPILWAKPFPGGGPNDYTLELIE